MFKLKLITFLDLTLFPRNVDDKKKKKKLNNGMNYNQLNIEHGYATR